MREVAAAMKQSSVQVSWVGLLPHGWSEEETKSKPSSSARIAVATGSAPGAAEVGMFSPNWIAFIARSFRRERRPLQQPERELGHGSDAEREGERADADRAAERCSGRERRELERGSHNSDPKAPPRPADDPHPVAPACAEPRPKIDAPPS